MDVFDTLAFLGRRFDRVTAPRSGSTRFTLGDLLEMFGPLTIHELRASTGNKPLRTVKPDSQRKIKVSLLDDGISEIHSDSKDWFEVFRTAPSGDLSWVKIVAHTPQDAVAGEIKMLVGRRDFAHYFVDDPVFRNIENSHHP